MTDELLRDLHDAAADSENPAEASLRPQGTTRRELRAMRRDVLRKLRVGAGMSAVELGCGVGLLSVPVARRAGRYLGLDFAPQAVRVANRRLREAGLAEDRARAVCADVLRISDSELEAFGRFERVLVYAVLQCVRDEEQGVRFLQRTLDLLAEGGRALVGNLPLSDLAVDWTAPDPPPHGLLQRARVGGRWILTPGTASVPLTRRWKARRAVERVIKLQLESPIGDFPSVVLPEHHTVKLSTETVERWLASLQGDFTYRWRLPAPGVPLVAGRADLVLHRR